ncbi:PAS domain S-box protein [Mariprofundus sp. EBB-1]|uniref:PAS domain S-box protein n=1 Tax=Mariprofundus sp. EBB-1 TaxID=2650971 RepID=UPI000EF1A672|nr:PAS domain S-box protein [Mariprofundus sp. EBB-1]RLL55665.1 PAS domain S-box protein [Mariprofundus sp. EBB-1]
MNLTIADILTRQVLTVVPETTLAAAALLMTEKRISCLVAVTDGKPVGVLTEADLVRVGHLRIDAEHTAISDFLSQPVISIATNQSIYAAFDFLLEHHVRHLVVVRPDGRLEGLLTFTDILKAAEFDDFLPVKSISSVMSRNVKTMQAEDSLHEAMATLSDLHISCVVIAEQGKAIGIFTERDAARLVAADRDLDNLCLADVMTTPLITMAADDSLLDASILMREKGFRRLVIVDEAAHPKGVITQFDVIRGLEGDTIRHFKQLHAKTEERLNESSRLLAEKSELERIVDASSAVLYRCEWIGEQFVGTYVSPSVTSLLGYDRQECLQPGWWSDHLHPDDRYKIEQNMPRLFETGEVEHVYRFAGKTGEYRWIRDHLRLRKGVDNRPDELIGSWLDITDSRKIEQRVFESEEMYRSLVEQSFDGIVILDAEGSMLFANDASAKAWGGTVEELSDQAFLDVIHPDEKARMQLYFKQRMDGAVQQEVYETRMVRKNGDTLWVELSGRLITWQKQPANLLTLRDISERKLAEMEEENRLLLNSASADAMSAFIADKPLQQVFDPLLKLLLDATQSAYGFIGEMLHSDAGAPYLKTFAVTDIAWNDETRSFYDENVAKGLEFHNLDTLFGAVLSGEEIVVSNDPANDARAGGIPKGHPPLQAFLGLPVKVGSKMLGMIGLANHPEGYDQAMIDRLAPLLDVIANIIVSMRSKRAHQQAEKALQDSESRLLASQAISQTGTWDWNPQSGDLIWSDETYRIHGYEPGQVKPSYELFLEHLHPDDRPMLAAAVEAALNDEQFYSLDCRLQSVDGKEKICHAQGGVEFDQDGQPLRMLGVFQDVTERKQVELSLDKSLQRMDFLLKSTPVVIYSCQPEPPFAASFVSLNVVDQLGYDAAQFTQQPDFWANHIHPDDREQVIAEMPRLFENGVHAHEYRFQHKDGSWRWMSDELRLTYNDAGEPTEIVGYWIDITARKQAEKAISISEKKFRSLFEESRDMMHMAGPDGRIIDVNQAELDTLGYSYEEMIGKPLEELVCPEYHEITMPKFSALMQGQSVPVYESAMHAKDGTCVHVEVSAVPQLDEHGDVTASRAIIRDISARKLAEKQIQDLYQQYESVTGSIADVLYYIDCNLKLVWWNRHLETITGLAPQDLQGRNADTFFAEADLPKLKQAIERTFSEGEAEDELFFNTIHGAVLHHFKGSLLKDGQGNVLGITGVGRDMTAIKQGEAQLKRREQQLSVLAEAGRVINEQLGEIEIGRSLATLARRLVECESGAVGFYRNEKICFREYLRAEESIPIALDFPAGYGVPGFVLETRAPYISADAMNDEHVIPEIQQSLVFMKLIDVPILDATGNILGCVEMHDRLDGHDFDDQDLEMLQGLAGIVAAALVNARQQNEIEQAAQRMRLILDAEFDAIVVQQDEKIVFSNKQAQQLFGYASFEETLGENAMLAFLPAQRNLAARIARRVIRNNKPTERVEMMGVSRSRSEPFPMEIASAPIQWSGKPAVVSIVRDITERKRAQTLLNQAYSRHEMAQRIAQLGHWDFDHINDRLEWSEGVYRIFGLDKADVELSYEMLQQLVHPDDREQLVRVFELSLENRASFELEHRIVLPNGEQRWVFEQCETEFSKDGTPIRSLGTVQDISERKHHLEQIERERAAMRAILNNLPFMAWLKDEEGRFIVVNDLFAEACGAESAEALVGKSDLDLWPEALATGYMQDDREVMDSATPKQVQELVEGKDGKGPISFETFKSPVFGSDGRVVGTAGMALDISDRLEREKQMRLLESAVGSVNESIIITNVEGVIVYVNPAFTSNTGFDRDYAIGNSPAILNSKQQSKGFYELFWQTIMAGEPWSGRILDRKKDGTIFPVHLSVAPIFDEPGEITHFVAVHEDLSSAEAMQKKMMQTQKMEAVGTMVGGLAHDFNNMLASIVGNFYLIRMQHKDDEKLIKRIEGMEKATHHGANMIQQMLTFARKDRPDMHVLSLNSYIKEAHKLAAGSVPENVHFKLDIGRGCDCNVKADATQLQQVLLNLVANARHAIRDLEHGEIRVGLDRRQPPEHVLSGNVELTADSSWCRIFSEDNGCGIREKDIERVFEPFFTTKAVGEGTGLGLAMVYGAVQNHRGLIDIDSTLGEGTTISIWLPEYAQKAAEVTGVDEAAVDGAGQVVLLVDDERELRHVLAEVLQHNGFKVLQAVDGEQAVETYERYSDDIDLVLMDVVMPNKGGVMAAKEIRAMNANVPIIFQTGYGEQTQLDAAASINNSDSLHKPVQIPKLLKKITEWIK